MSGVPCLTFHAMTASRTTPTLCVLVIMTGPFKNPESSTHVVPVISPLPLSVNQAAKTASLLVLPLGCIAVTPVRTGPLPISSLPSPEMSVVWPTSTPLTSVIALLTPGVPSKGTPRSRARGLVCPPRITDSIMTAAANVKSRTEIRDIAPPGKQAVYKAAVRRMVRCLVRHCCRDFGVQSALGTPHFGGIWITGRKHSFWVRLRQPPYYS